MAVEDRHTVACGRDDKVTLLSEGGTGVVQTAENLAGLGLKFILFSRDKGHYVVNNVHGADARVACSGDGLHGDDANCVNGAKSGLEGGKRDDKTNDGTVGVADEESLLEVIH